MIEEWSSKSEDKRQTTIYLYVSFLSSLTSFVFFCIFITITIALLHHYIACMSFRLALTYSDLMCKLRVVIHQTYWIIITPIMYWMNFYDSVFKSLFLKWIWLSCNWFTLERIMSQVISFNDFVGLIYWDTSILSLGCILLLRILKSQISFMGSKMFL